MTLLRKSLRLAQFLKFSDKLTDTAPVSHAVEPSGKSVESRKLRQATRSLSHSTDSLSSFVTLAIDNMETISQSISEIVNSSNYQSKEAEKSLQEAENLGQALNRSLTHMNEMGYTASQSMLASETGQAAVKQLSEHTMVNNEISADLKLTMEQLKAHSAEISKALELIFGVTQNIQMLSLNASIEAAHAGEHGKGFSVVASEVRKLAQESAINGKQIKALLNGVQEQVEKFDRIVEQSRESSDKVAQGVEKTRQQFELINRNLHSVTRHTGEVTDFLELASLKKDKLIHNFHTVVSLTQQSLAAAYEVAHLSENQASSVLSVAGATQDLQSIHADIKDSLSVLIGDETPDDKREVAQVRIGFIPNLSHAPALLAVENQAFREQFAHQVDTKVFSAGPALVDALIHNQIDIGYSGPGPVFEAFAKSGKIKILSGVNSGGTALLVNSKSTIKQISQLLGTTIAIPQYGNGQHILLRQLLKSNGLKDVFRGGDIRIIQAKPSSLSDLFDRGEIDAALVQEPWVTLLENKGSARVLVDWDQIYATGHPPNTVIAVSQRYYENYPDRIAKFLHFHDQSLRSIQEGREETYEALSLSLARYTGQPLPIDLIKRALKRIIWKSETDPAHLRQFAELIKQEGFLNKDIDFDLLIAQITDAR